MARKQRRACEPIGTNGTTPLCLVYRRLSGHCEQQMVALAKAGLSDEIQHCLGVGADLLVGIT